MSAGYPLFVLGVGLIVVVGGIVVLRMHAFLALISAATVVSLLAPGDWSDKIPRVAEAFGTTAAGVGVVIALAAIIGVAMTASGAADRIVRFFLALFGEKRGDTALMASGFTLAIPVFFDTVFFLLVPLVRSMYRRVGRHYLRFLMAAASCAVAHALVPPTPGPLLVADTLGVDLGVMMIVGTAVAVPAAIASLAFAAWADRRMPVTPPPPITEAPTVIANRSGEGPGLGWSLLPILLPVALITGNTVAGALDLGEHAPAAAAVLAVAGNPQFALLLAAFLALWTYWRLCRPTATQMSDAIGEALMAAGVIVLITCAGGAFGGALRAAELSEAIKAMAGDAATGGIGLLLMAFGVASLIKFAQGSSTAAMIVTSAMFAAMIDPGALGYHPVYLATAIGSGSLVGSWMNDSGFWIFARMGGLTELQALKTWTPLLVLLGAVSMVMTLVLAILLPMPPA
ncbi:MAG TPA: SLC13 family permease [Woeseiaceae bacterium]|nr:SLC13 family permease [Woeseiaceae bacterium]